MKSDIRFRDFFKNEMFQHKNFSEEFMEEQIAFYSTENFNVSNKVKLALETTLPSDMYQYDHVHGDKTNKRTLWANKAYSYFIEEKNEILIGQNRPKIEEFPIKESIISELVEYWTPLILRH
jgi:hypothetical protein